MSDNVMIGPPKLTRFERARIAGARALQVSLGAPILVELPPKMSDPIDIALIEIKEGVLPMTIRRTLGKRESTESAACVLCGTLV